MIFKVLVSVIIESPAVVVGFLVRCIANGFRGGWESHRKMNTWLVEKLRSR